MATKEDLKDIVDAALDHAREHDYRPGECDDDMLETAVYEEALKMDFDLSDDETRTAVEQMRQRLNELDEDPAP